MSDKVNDGGPAFPGNGEFFVDGPQGRMLQSAWGAEGAKGMSLRDWFAGQALAGWLACLETTGEPESGAEYCYTLADAMLAAREKKGGAEGLRNDRKTLG